MKESVGVVSPDVDAHGDGCEYHEAGLQLVAMLVDHLIALEERVEALEERERACVDATSG